MKFWRQLTAGERSDAIREFCEPGMSAASIAFSLARDGGIFEATRNAVIGHIHRNMRDWPMGIRKVPPKTKPVANGKRPWRLTITPANRTETRLKRLADLSNPPPPVAVELADPEGRNKILLDDMPMMGRCRYPLWPDNAFPKPEEMYCCGETTLEGSSWCGFHHDRCVSKVAVKPIFTRRIRAYAAA